MTGRFIVLEGGEGAGKSTQLDRLAARLRDRGCDVVTTFEPGDTPLGAQIRAMTHHFDGPMDPRAEALLMAADRAQHVATVVRPALTRGAVVISDRYIPSSIAYQGVARGLGVDAIAQLSAWATDDLEQDCVIVLDVDGGTVGTRIPAATDRLEAEGVMFHNAVRRAYLDLAAQHAWPVIDGTADPDTVADAVWTAVVASVPEWASER